MKNAKTPLKIGNAGGFWGDNPLAPAILLQQQPDLDFLTLDYLAEVSMSIMAIQYKDATSGFARDFVQVVASLVPAWKAGSPVKIVTNAGGLNPQGCAAACHQVLKEAGLSRRIAWIEGDQVLTRLQAHPTSPLFCHLDSGLPLSTIQNELVTANAYLGASSIAEALKLGADIVITGRVADPSLTVGPCLYHYGWSPTDYHRIAGATIAGHLIECGTQATGGISTHWLSLPDPAHIGFPVVEILADGRCILTKPAGTGGEVSLRTTKEQLLYEIGDPARYLSPDVTVSFLGLELQDLGNARILIAGALGSAPPNTYKVSATYKRGYRCEALLALAGPDVEKKGKLCGEIVRLRLQDAGFKVEAFQVECIGAGALAPHILPAITPHAIAPFAIAPFECMLRLAVADSRYAALECFAKQIAPLVTSGPQGVTGYISGRPKIRPVFGYWPCLIDRDLKERVCMHD